VKSTEEVEFDGGASAGGVDENADAFFVAHAGGDVEGANVGAALFGADEGSGGGAIDDEKAEHFGLGHTDAAHDQKVHDAKADAEALDDAHGAGVGTLTEYHVDDGVLLTDSNFAA
jgi:hypothetical protein